MVVIKFKKGDKVKFVLNDYVKKGEIVGCKGIILRKYIVSYIESYARDTILIKHKNIIKITDDNKVA